MGRSFSSYSPPIAVCIQYYSSRNFSDDAFQAIVCMCIIYIYATFVRRHAPQETELLSAVSLWLSDSRIICRRAYNGPDVDRVYITLRK